MNNSILQSLKKDTNFGYTENNSLKHLSTLDKVYDLFAFGAAYRTRSENDCIVLFKSAYEQDKELALKCLFYLRDVRGGQGERRFFKICLKWLADNDPDVVKKNIDNVSEYGRWDDLFALMDTKLEDYMLFKVKEQLALDMDCKTPSLLGKWMPSENASSRETKKLANKIRKYLKMTHKEYRIMLSELRKKINIVERLMSTNRWEEIEFDKIPSKAGLIYKNAFARRDLIAKKYKDFIKSESTKVNAKTLYPYDVVAKAIAHERSYYNSSKDMEQTDRAAIEKYWSSLPEYFKNDDGSNNMLCVVDTSGSMWR